MSFTSVSFFQFPPSEYSVKWYISFLENRDWVDGLLNSLNIAICTAIDATILGTMTALAANKLSFWGKKVFMSLMVAPMIIPVIIVGIALYHSFAPLKLTNRLIGLVPDHSLLAIPIVFVLFLLQAWFSARSGKLTPD